MFIEGSQCHLLGENPAWIRQLMPEDHWKDCHFIEKIDMAIQANWLSLKTGQQSTVYDKISLIKSNLFQLKNRSAKCRKITKNIVVPIEKIWTLFCVYLEP